MRGRTKWVPPAEMRKDSHKERRLRGGGRLKEHDRENGIRSRQAGIDHRVGLLILGGGTSGRGWEKRSWRLKKSRKGRPQATLRKRARRRERTVVA